MRRTLGIAIIALVLLPSVASAEQITKLDFRNGQTAGRWHISASEAVRVGPEGMNVSATADMIMYRMDPLPHATDVLELGVINAAPLQLTFLWRPRGTPEGEFIQLPISIDAAPDGKTVMVPLDRFPQWDPRADMIGLYVPAGSHFTLTEIRLHRYAWNEKAVQMWRSFWTFDVFTRYTINFVWGPLIAFTPQTTHDLFSQLPPLGWSFYRILYPILGIVGVCTGMCALLLRRTPAKKRIALMTLIWTFAGAWLLLDLRMGLEILSYVKSDYQHYLAPPLEQKEFRYMADFQSVLEQTKPYLQGKNKIGFITEPQLLLDTTVTYEFYPTEMVLPGEDHTDVDLWLVYLRRDIQLNDADQLAASDGTVFTPPGKIIKQFGSRGLLFSTSAE